MKAKQILSFLIVIAMVLAVVPALAETAPEATIYLTVSNQGALASDNNGSPMANRPVTVTDVNEDGTLTYEEALIAAHKTYNSEDGYLAPSGFVSKLWGVDSQNNLFFINNKGLETGVSGDTVKDGDYLVASINKDSVYWADWYTFFDKMTVTAKKGEEITLNIKGHLGMAYTPEALEDKALEGLKVGMLENGSFIEIENAVTDENGNVSVSFNEAGTYYVTAEGTVSATVTDYNLIKLGGDPVVYGTVDFTTSDSTVAYTEPDYGDGPYPANEILYMDFNEWKESENEYNVLHTNQIITECPIIAPVCIVEVKEKEKPQVLDNIASRLSNFAISEDNNMQWIIADLTAYSKLFPETENKITQTEKQKCIDKIIKDVETTTKPGNLAKDIIALRAMGFDPQKLYNEKSQMIDGVEKLALMVDEKNEDVTYMFTLPYVIIALQQGEYMTEEREKFLISAAIATKENWQSTDWITDGATPMLVALAPYRDREEVESVIEETVNIVKTQQETGAVDNGASIGLGIWAFATLGEECDTLTSALMTYVNENLDGFLPEENMFTTEQGFRGLLAAYAEENIYNFANMPLNEARATLKQEVQKPTGTGGGSAPIVKEETKEENKEKPEEEIKEEVKEEYKEEVKVFEDVDKDEWYASAVEYAVANNLMMGVSETEFMPENKMTRAMLVTVLYRMAGEPETKFKETFNDVESDSWYSKSVMWATENKIVAGYEDNTFKGDENITREQLAVILYRFAEGGEVEDCTSAYEDADEISDYAKTALNWAVANKLINGISDKKLSPSDNATRAQIATIIMRYAQFIKGE